MEQLKRLFDLLEENLDAPAALIEVHNTGRRPLQVVGDEGHDRILPVDLDNSHDPPKDFGIISATLVALENDQVVAQDVSSRFAKQALSTAASHVVLGACNPKHPPLRELEQMLEIHVGLVEEDDFAPAHTGAQFSRTFTIALTRRIDDGEPRQERLQIQSQVHFRCRLPASMTGPVDTVRNQLDRGGVDNIDHTLEPARETTEGPTAESRGDMGQVMENAPE